MLRRDRHGFAGLVLAALLALHCNAQGVITTIAGGANFFRGNGGPALAANLGQMTYVAFDASGNLYASDFDHDIVVRIAPDGILTVVAGNGIQGYSGDGGPATSASLNLPAGLAVDAAGNLYIADQLNLRVRKVTPDGIITTFAGNGGYGFTGDGGPATSAQISQPIGLAVDSSGNLYIAQTIPGRIRRVAPNGTITTVAGSDADGFSGDGGPATSAQLSSPTGVAFDVAGNLYIADHSNHRIRKMDTNGIITTVVGIGTTGLPTNGMSALSAPGGFPRAVAVDASGNIFYTPGANLYKVDTAGIVTSLGTAGHGMALDGSGNLYVASTYFVRKIDSTGKITVVAGMGAPAFGDGGPATSAGLSRPTGLAFDGAGNLYVADSLNYKIRKITPSGTISTVAGNGTLAISGDGGPATQASFRAPQSVLIDNSGNLLIADRSNIRKVTPAGLISTIAGGGSGGDGGPATSASLIPVDLAMDAAGILYFSEPNRIRKISASGIVSTVAGTGVQGFSGDGGLATSAMLSGAGGIAVDGSGNLYIADTGNGRVRRVGTDGRIMTIAGAGAPTTSASALAGATRVAVDSAGNLYIAGNKVYKLDPSGNLAALTGGDGSSGDGQLAINASVNPVGMAFDSAGNLYVADFGNDRVRKILATPPAATVSATALSFSGQSGGPASSPQDVTVSSPVTGLTWSIQTSTSSGGNWLSVTPSAGSTPGTFAASVNPANLAPGTYQGSITVRTPQGSPDSHTVTVQATVSAQPSQLSVSPLQLTFQARAETGNPPSQTLRVANAGGGSLSWTASVSTQSGGSWLAVTPASGSATGNSPANAVVSVNTSNLAAGVYSGSVTVTSAAAGQNQVIPVTLLLSPGSQILLLSQTGLSFTGVEGAGVTPSQSFGVLNIGQGTASWTASATTLSGGSWLSVSPASGTSTANSLVIPIVDVRVRATGMRSGQYSGLIKISALGANNSPQFVTVDLNVLPPGSNPGAFVRPTGLIFAARAGDSSPSSQTVTVATATTRNVEARTGLQTFDGATWLDALPKNAVFTGGSPSTVTIQPSLGSLAPGIYRGALTYLFDDGSPLQAVNVLFVVVSSPQGAASASNPAATSCTAQKMLAVFRSLGTSFSSSVARPTTIEAQVVDDCGNAVANATVVASFSNGDPALSLVSLGNGVYTGTWRPVAASSQVAVLVRAVLPPLTAAEITALGQVNSNPSAPSLNAAGVVDAASFSSGAPLAPGSIISVFGRNLAGETIGASNTPLPTSMGGTSLSVGDTDVPLLFAANGQINAQLPFELAPNSQPHVVVKTGTTGSALAVTVPETITVTATRPTIFTTNQRGTGQGAILNASFRLVDGSAPAAAGEVIQVYCTGLGLTNPRVVSGQASPNAEPLARVVAPVQATIGGRPATVQFAGLTPGFVGLYQVNVQVPAGTVPGPSVPLVLIQGTASNTVTLAVR